MNDELAVRAFLHLKKSASLCSELNQCTTNIMLYQDNQACVGIIRGHCEMSRTKHMEIKYYSLQEKFKNKEIDVIYVPSEQMKADGLTKSLGKVKFEDFIKSLRLKAHDERTN